MSIDSTLAALADPHRRRIVDLLREGPRAAGELGRSLGVPAPSISRHLKALREAGLVEDEHAALDSRVRIYSLKTAPLAEMIAWLGETERMWSDQLLAFKAHVEASSDR